MTTSRLLSVACAVLFTFITVSANAALVSRLDGDAAWDDVLDITWLTDADLSGPGTWQDQLDWIDSLNTANHLGFNDWRLASMSVTDGTPDAGHQTSIDSCTIGVACPTNELGHMYYYNLASITSANKAGTHPIGDVTLTDVQADYWSGTEFGDIASWRLYFGNGFQGEASKIFNTRYGWAVRAGDVGVAVSSVPVPAAVWLFGSGLLGLVGIARRRKAA